MTSLEKGFDKAYNLSLIISGWAEIYQTNLEMLSACINNIMFNKLASKAVKDLRKFAERLDKINAAVKKEGEPDEPRCTSARRAKCHQQSTRLA